MGLSHRKRVRRNVEFFCNTFGFRPPFKVLVDGNFLHLMLQTKQGEPEEVLTKLYGNTVTVFSTPCITHELQSLGRGFEKTVKLSRSLKLHRCQHDPPLAPAECLLSQLAEENKDHWWIGTQDEGLRKSLRKLPNAPCWHLTSNGVSLERPSEAALKLQAKMSKERMGMAQWEKTTEALKDLDELTEKEKSKFRRKHAKGPNPLSCKKRKRKNVEGNFANGNGNEGGQKKRPRRRKKSESGGQQVDNA